MLDIPGHCPFSSFLYCVFPYSDIFSSSYRSMWTDTPEMKAKKERGEVVEEPEVDEKEELEHLLVHQR